MVYDADEFERPGIRAILNRQLHWIQNSVFAGELTRTAAMDLLHQLEDNIEEARVTFWVYDRKPETWNIGAQEDEESIFL